jgi:hypothetical protein
MGRGVDLDGVPECAPAYPKFVECSGINPISEWEKAYWWSRLPTGLTRRQNGNGDGRRRAWGEAINLGTGVDAELSTVAALVTAGVTWEPHWIRARVEVGIGQGLSTRIRKRLRERNGRVGEERDRGQTAGRASSQYYTKKRPPWWTAANGNTALNYLRFFLSFTFFLIFYSFLMIYYFPNRRIFSWTWEYYFKLARNTSFEPTKHFLVKLIRSIKSRCENY